MKHKPQRSSSLACIFREISRHILLKRFLTAVRLFDHRAKCSLTCGLVLIRPEIDLVDSANLCCSYQMPQACGQGRGWIETRSMDSVFFAFEVPL